MNNKALDQMGMEDYRPEDLMKWYENILELLPDGIMIVDKDGVIVFANKASLRFNSCEKEELVGINVRECEKKQLFNPSASLLSLQSGKPERIIQDVKNHKRLMVFAYPITDMNSEITHVLTVSSDVTEHINLKQQVEEKEYLIEYYKQHPAIQSIARNESQTYYSSDQMIKLEDFLRRVSKSDINILITGESGVGKTFYAKRIHNNSIRKKKPFIVINCSTIPESLIESELFGYMGGTFTGALNKGKPGLFESANGGTVFLDEIGELPVLTQVKLLEVIQERKIRRIGGDKEIAVDFRLITATNQDLEYLIEKKEFREDLYYRLKGLEINIPPVREHPDDIPHLILHFLNIQNKKHVTNKRISQKLLHQLKSYPWPGNIRELEHVVESAYALSEYDLITMDDLPENFQYLDSTSDLYGGIEDKPLSLKESLEIMECELIRNTYEEQKNSYKVGEVLQISQSSAWRKIKKYCNKIYEE